MERRLCKIMSYRDLVEVVTSKISTRTTRVIVVDVVDGRAFRGRRDTEVKGGESYVAVVT